MSVGRGRLQVGGNNCSEWGNSAHRWKKHQRCSAATGHLRYCCRRHDRMVSVPVFQHSSGIVMGKPTSNRPWPSFSGEQDMNALVTVHKRVGASAYLHPCTSLKAPIYDRR